MNDEQREHQFYKCRDDCDGCQFCLGGLVYCVVCKKGEVELEQYCEGETQPEAA